jgi:hypothetical protein
MARPPNVSSARRAPSLEPGDPDALEDQGDARGDLLGDVWSKVAWINLEDRRDRGLLAEVPFASRPIRQLLGAMASVAIDLASTRLGHPCRGLDHRDRGRDRQGPRGLFKGLRKG